MKYLHYSIHYNILQMKQISIRITYTYENELNINNY